MGVGITSVICMSRVPSCSIQRILHGDVHENGLHDEKCSPRGKPRKIGAKREWCHDDIVGDQKLRGQRSRCA